MYQTHIVILNLIYLLYRLFKLLGFDTAIKPPYKNLEVKYDSNYLFAKNSPDQWSLVLTGEKEHNQILIEERKRLNEILNRILKKSAKNPRQPARCTPQSF